MHSSLGMHFLFFETAIKSVFAFALTANNYGGIIMPSTVILEKKQAQVAALAERIKGSIAGVVVDYKGINVEDDTKLRRELREAGVEYTVVKNTLLKKSCRRCRP